jgi:hypothetical protein
MVDRTAVAQPNRLVAPTPEDASRSLADLGFLVRSDLPDRAGPAYLLVALRDHPAMTHYDPEVVDYWVSRNGFGRREQLTRSTPLPIEDRLFSWGEIRIIDRLHITNEYLTFGGHLSAALVNGVTIAVFESTVPLLRRGGHSQGWDEAAENVGAFFGRAKIAVDYVPGFEARLAALRPEARYSAFVVDLAERYRSEPALRDAHPRLWSLLATEEHRIVRSYSDDVGEGRRLVAEMQLV